MRLLFHGKLSIFASALHYFWHASFDPYDKSERMELRGKNINVDWYNGKHVIIPCLITKVTRYHERIEMVTIVDND